MNSAKRDVWRTPEDLWQRLHNQYQFEFDACADAKNRKVHDYSRDFEDKIFLNPDTMIWMNPPFSKALAMFTRLVIERRWVAIYRSDNMETKVWQDVIFPRAEWVFMFNYRVKYIGFDGDSSRFPSALIGRGVPFPRGFDGICFHPLNHGVK
jgi:hypothetical protein